MGHQPSKQQHHRQHQAAKYDLHQLAVITVVFTPVRYASRYGHDDNFARHTGASGVNLYTVECILPSTTRFGLPQQNFEITQPNNHRHIQLVAPSILWMKENLISIAVNRCRHRIRCNQCSKSFATKTKLLLSVCLATGLTSLDNC